MSEVMGIRPWEHDLMTVEQMDDALAYTEETIRKLREAGQ
jgi:hypothetical protein